MIQQFVNKITEILTIATSHKPHLCNYYNHVFALLISMPRFNSINFFQNWLKIKLFLPKEYKIFERWSVPLAAGGSAPNMGGPNIQPKNCRIWVLYTPFPPSQQLQARVKHAW